MENGILRWVGRIVLIVWIVLVLATFVALIWLSSSLPLNEDYTLATKWTYISGSLAGLFALMASIIGIVWENQRRYALILLTIAVEFFLAAMLFQILTY